VQSLRHPGMKRKPYYGIHDALFGDLMCATDVCKRIGSLMKKFPPPPPVVPAVPVVAPAPPVPLYLSDQSPSPVDSESHLNQSKQTRPEHKPEQTETDLSNGVTVEQTTTVYSNKPTSRACASSIWKNKMKITYS
jgi:hypothetical protein